MGNIFTEAKTSALLQTVIATIVNSENPEISIQARIIFDRAIYYSWHFLNGNIRQGELGPVSTKYMFGWVLSGPVESDVESTQVNLTYVLRASNETAVIHPGDERLEKRLHQF